ncbi:MAG: hypothetical protein ACJASQ_004051 [Crocinitomicaceae bacterium]|jgi:hypothetical protein
MRSVFITLQSWSIVAGKFRGECLKIEPRVFPDVSGLLKNEPFENGFSYQTCNIFHLKFH